MREAGNTHCQPHSRSAFGYFRGRVSNVDLGDEALGAKLAKGTKEAWAYTAGLNWYLNKAFKLQFNYERTDFDGKPKFGTNTRDHEDVLITRFQIAY